MFFANTAAQFGGGLYTNVTTTTVTLEASSFDYNHAATGGGLTRVNAHLAISRSSFTNNVAQIGGGLSLLGLPNPDSAGYVEVRDSTISSNLATLTHSGGVDNSALLDLRNVTIKDNKYGLFDVNGAIARLQSSVLVNTGGLNCDGDGTLPSSSGHNYSTDNSCELSGNQDTQGTGLDAELGSLTGDPLVLTKFHMPLPNSPLINHGGPVCSPTDQRYAVRPDACDTPAPLAGQVRVGAIEFGGLLLRLFVPLILK